MATYRVILEQNPSSILISDAIGPEKWVVENFDFISPGLLCTKKVKLNATKNITLFFSSVFNVLSNGVMCFAVHVKLII